MYIWLIHFVVQQKLTHCKAIILQIKNKLKKKKDPNRLLWDRPSKDNSKFPPQNGVPGPFQNIANNNDSSRSSSSNTNRSTNNNNSYCWILCVHAQSLSCVWLLQPLTAAHQAPLSIGILQARILKWVLPFPPPRDLPNPGIESLPPVAPVLPSGFFWGFFIYVFIEI